MAPAATVKVPPVLVPPLVCKPIVPAWTSMVPLLTKLSATVEVPVPADFSRVPSLVKSAASVTAVVGDPGIDLEVERAARLVVQDDRVVEVQAARELIVERPGVRQRAAAEQGECAGARHRERPCVRQGLAVQGQGAAGPLRAAGEGQGRVGGQRAPAEA